MDHGFHSCNATWSVQAYPNWEARYLDTVYGPVAIVDNVAAILTCHVLYTSQVHPSVSRVFNLALQFVTSLFRFGSNCLFEVLTLDVDLSPIPQGQNFTVGRAFFGQNRIELYPNRMSSNDMLYLVSVHELLHLVGFNHDFHDRIEVNTSIYNSDLVADCLADGQAARGSTDLYHWHPEDSRFSLMHPILSSSSHLTRCSVVAAAENADIQTQLCNTDGDCEDGSTCGMLTSSIRGCTFRNMTEIRNFRQPYNTFPTFFAVVIAVSVTAILLITCARKTYPNNRVASVIQLTPN